MGCEVERAARVDHALGLAPLEQTLRVVEQIALHRIALRGIEQRHLVIGPAAREIDPQAAVAL